MSSYRETTIAGKAAKRGIVEQRPVASKSKRPRPVVVEYRRAGNLPHDWRSWKSYRTAAEAEMAMAGMVRKYTWNEYRIKP